MSTEPRPGLDASPPSQDTESARPDSGPAPEHLPAIVPASIGVIEELLVPYDLGPLTEKLVRRRRALRSRLISLLITVVILVLLYLFGGDQFRAGSFLTLFGVALGVSVAWFLGYLVAYLLARRELKGVGTGTAVRIGRPGVQVGGVFAPWPEVRVLTMATGRFGRRPRLELHHGAGRSSSVPLNQMVVHAATLDSTARAYSGGRHGVDLTALDS